MVVNDDDILYKEVRYESYFVINAKKFTIYANSSIFRSVDFLPLRLYSSGKYGKNIQLSTKDHTNDV